MQKYTEKTHIGLESAVLVIVYAGLAYLLLGISVPPALLIGFGCSTLVALFEYITS